MTMLDVSVIIATYNRPAMVREAIESVLAQRGASFELIVIDDGSQDGSDAIVEEFAHENRMRFECTQNHGPAAARNRGVEMAQGPLVAFLDSDDLWLPNKLERQIEFMRAHPECSISQCNEIWMRNGRRVNPGERHRKRSGDFFVESLSTCLISPSAVIMRTELFRSMGGFDDSLRAAEDYDLWLRTMVEHEAELLDEPLVIRRGGHRDQLSTTTPAIDRFRILSLTKLLGCERLASERRAKTIEVLVEKCGIYSKGLRRRGRNEQAEFYEQIAAHAAHWDSSRAVEISRAVETMRSRLAETSETSESCLMKSWDHAYWLPDGIHND